MLGARTHLVDHEPATAHDRDAADLLARRDTLTATQHAQFNPRLHTQHHTRDQTRDNSLDL